MECVKNYESYLVLRDHILLLASPRLSAGRNGCHTIVKKMEYCEAKNQLSNYKACVIHVRIQKHGRFAHAAHQDGMHGQNNNKYVMQEN